MRRIRCADDISYKVLQAGPLAAYPWRAKPGRLAFECSVAPLAIYQNYAKLS